MFGLRVLGVLGLGFKGFCFGFPKIRGTIRVLLRGSLGFPRVRVPFEGI